MDEKQFMIPGNECRGTDFWMLNDTLEEGELRRQMAAMRRQGMTSLIARTYIGLKSDYPGPDFMHKMHVVVEEARKLGMTIFMQAGYMPEAVLDLPVEYSLGDVRVFPQGEGGGTLLCSHEGKDYRLNPSITILDMLNPEAARFYVRQSYENTWSDFKDAFGEVIESVWVDEPSYRKAMLPWTDGLPEAFESLWGYAFPMDKLYLLFEGEEDAKTLRYHYWRTVLHLIKNAYFAEVRAWCRENGVLFSGHLMAEDFMEAQMSATCFTMPLYQYFDMPGIDYLTAEMNWRYGEIKAEQPGERDMWAYGRYVTPLQCSSAAHQTGKQRVLAEMYGVSTENLTLRDQRRMFDMFAAVGINHRSVHGSFYSLRGRGKRAYPPHVNDYQPYFPKYHLLTDTLARESWFVRQGKPAADVVMLHPMDSGFCEYQASGDRTALRRRDRAFLEITRTLAGRQICFEYGDEDTIAERGQVGASERFEIGEMSYRTVILPRMDNIRTTTLSLLEQFMRLGGQVIVLGDIPKMVDGYPDERAREILQSAQQAGSLRVLCDLLEAAPSSFRYQPKTDASRVSIHYREDGASRLFFLTNNDCAEPGEGALTLDGAYAAERFFPEDGRIAPAGVIQESGKTSVPVCLEAGGSLLLRLTPDAAAQPPDPVRTRCVLPLKGGWKMTRRHPNVLLLEFCTLRQGDGAVQGPYPIMAVQDLLTDRAYQGEITLSYTFHTEIPLRGAKLAMESPLDQSLTLDGKPLSSQPAGYFWAKAFETVPLPDLEAGAHELIIRRHFQPVRKAKMAVTSLFENLGGVELEPILLLGDFAVRTIIEPGVQGCVRMNPDFVLAAEGSACEGEIVREGYPFYAGEMVLRKQFTLAADQISRPLSFALEGLHACACEVFVNGQSAGTLCWAPYRVSLEGLVKEGDNTLELVLYNSLRNLLGPWHRPVGEIGACWAGYEHPNQPWTGAVEGGVPDPEWMDHRYPDRRDWTESYLLLPFGIAGPHWVMDEKV